MFSVAIASSLSSSSSAFHGRPKDSIFVTSVPLRASKGPAQLFMSSAYNVGLWDLQHFMVIVSPPESQVLVFDFQPQDPESFYAAFAVLTRKEIPGVVMRRKLQKLPSRRCWFVGYSNSDGVNVANKFSDGWPTNLIIGKHDCRHFTNELVEQLTGEQRVLDNIRASSNS